MHCYSKKSFEEMNKICYFFLTEIFKDFLKELVIFILPQSSEIAFWMGESHIRPLYMAKLYVRFGQRIDASFTLARTQW